MLKKFPCGTTPNDIPHTTCRIFYTKLLEFLNNITQEKIFGRVDVFACTFEFQKRLLPHAHLILTLNFKDKIKNAEEIDKIIFAEIPNHDNELKKSVIKHMLHGLD